MIKYSVIIPVYNNKDCLDACLTTLKKQAKKEFEFIVIDDGSTQFGLEKVAKKHKARLIRLKKNSGAGNARNKGVKFAKGKYLVFIDSDILVPVGFFSYLKKQIYQMDENCCLQGVYGISTPADNLYSQYKNLYYYYNFFFRIKKEDFSYVSSHCFVIPKHIFKKVNGFNPNIRTVIEDADFSYRLLKKGYQIIMDKKLKVTHLKLFSFSNLLMNDANLSFAKAKHVLRNIFKDDTDKLIVISGGKLSEMYPVVFNVLLSPLFLVLVFMNLVSTNDFRFFSFWGWVLLFLLINWKFFRFIRKKKNFGFLIQMIPFYYLDMLFAFFGVIFGVFDYLILRNKY